MELLLKDDRWCFACGHHNPHGLHLQDIHLEDDACVCTFTPEKWHQGWAEILHGGITSTLLDEVMTHLIYRRGLDAVTAEMTVRLKARIPIGEPVRVEARFSRMRGKFAETEGVLLLADGTTAATSTAKFFVSPRELDGPTVPILTLAGRRAVIFDLFGTLVPVFDRTSYFAVLDNCADALGVERECFRNTFRADAAMRTTGQWANLEENLADIARRLGHEVSAEAIGEAAAIRTAYTRQHLMNPHPDALAALASLREAGVPVQVISDCSPETPPLWSESPLAEFVPDPVLSCAVGMRKPDPAIYALACARLGADPREVVYVGDGDSEELPGAQRQGIFAVWVDRGETSAFRTRQHTDCQAVVHSLEFVPAMLGIERTTG